MIRWNEPCGWIFNRHKAISFHLVDADLARRSKSIFDAAQQAQIVLSFTFEIEHHIDYMLHQFGTRYIAILGDVANQDDRDRLLFGDLLQTIAALPDLADRTGHGFQVKGIHGLYGINDHYTGIDLVDGLEDIEQIGFSEHVAVFAFNTESFCAQFDLHRTFLSRYVEQTQGRVFGELEQQR